MLDDGLSSIFLDWFNLNGLLISTYSKYPVFLKEYASSSFIDIHSIPRQQAIYKNIIIPPKSKRFPIADTCTNKINSTVKQPIAGKQLADNDIQFKILSNCRSN